MNNKNYDKFFKIPDGILSDLCSRFIVNVPEEERTDLIRIFFQIEIAHWFYLDFYCDTSQFGISGSSSSSDEDESSNENLIQQNPTSQNQTLKPCNMRVFAENIFRHCPFLMQHSHNVDDILSKWKVFKHSVPTNGAIIIDESMRHVLLVQGFWAKASWGFPKGKVFEEETERLCAIREVLEETGYDISKKLVDSDFLQININDQVIKLYIVTNVPKETKFEPKTRREIKEVRWFPIEDLPLDRKDNRCKHKLGFSPNSFFMVIPFVKSLNNWIRLRSGGGGSDAHANRQSKLSNGHKSYAEISPFRIKNLNSSNKGNHRHSSSRDQFNNVSANSYEIKLNFKENKQNESSQSVQSRDSPREQNKIVKREAATKLQFNGPDCWINFKFDYNSILQSLPPAM